MEEEGYDVLFKIILVGDTSVGKTNIINKYIKNEFHEDFLCNNWSGIQS